MIRLFFDMGGTLARFYEREGCVDKHMEPGFFNGLRAYEQVLELVKAFHSRSDVRTYVLSAANGSQAVSEKQEWLARHLPGVTIGTFFVNVGANKAEYIREFYGALTKEDVLIDGYSKNLVEWEAAGGRAIKMFNELNGRGWNGTHWNGPCVDAEADAQETYRKMCKMLELNVPKKQQTLVMMCGLPASGKSYIAQTLHEICPEMRLIASDDIRKDLYGDEAAQGDPEVVFAEVNRRISEALESGQSVIYDATNCYPWSRQKILDLIPAEREVSVRFWHIDTPLDVCLERNANRKRQVPENLILKMAKKFQAPTKREWTAGPCVVVRKAYTV